MAARTCWLAVVVAFSASAAGAGATQRTQITVWSQPAGNPLGGTTYGNTLATPTTGAMITEQRDLDLGTGEVRITGIATTVDPASVQLRSLTDPSGVAVSEQRFVPGATTPDEILSRHVGDTVSVVTVKGEVGGVLRAVDPQALVVEVGTGDQRRLQVMRRDGYVQDVKLPAGSGIDRPSLVWRVAAKKPGKHNVEITYRADGMSWTADYLAVLDDAARAVDFSAWATIKNATGASFDNAEVTLVAAGGSSLTAALPFVAPHTSPASSRFTVPTPVHIGNGETVQVELMPARTAAKARSLVIYETATIDPSAGPQTDPQVDCSALTGLGGAGTGHAEIAVELDVPSQSLPDGRVRLFKRRGDKLEVISEDQLRTAAGVARIRIANDNDIVGDRHQVSCTTDERTRTIHEKLEVELENHGKIARDLVVREQMWRWPVWKIEGDESPRGVRAGPQTQEYRLSLPPGGKKSVTYSVVYTW